jgi:hypothetical protein
METNWANDIQHHSGTLVDEKVFDLLSRKGHLKIARQFTGGKGDGGDASRRDA